MKRDEASSNPHCVPFQSVFAHPASPVTQIPSAAAARPRGRLCQIRLVKPRSRAMARSCLCTTDGNGANE